MIEDLQFYFEKEKPSEISKSKLEQYRINNHLEQNKQNENENPEEVDEGPTLALFLLGNNFKKMTDLNFSRSKKAERNSTYKQTIEEKDDESKLEETQRLCEQQEANRYKNNNQNEQIQLQTDAINFENELQQIPINIKSNSSLKSPLMIDSPIQLQQSEGVRKQSNDYLKESNDRVQSFDINLKSGYSNSFQNTTKSTIGLKFPSNDSYIRNESESMIDNLKNGIGKTKFSLSDTKLNTTQIKKKKKYCSSPNTIKFRWRYFLKFFFYHILYYYIFGPITPYILMYVFKQSKQTCQNMCFIGFNKVNIVQFWFYLINVLSIVIYFNVSQNIQNEYLIYFLTYFYTNVIKIVIQTLKYGFFNSSQLKTIKTKVLTWNEQRKEFIFGLWFDQDDEIIFDEIESAKQRLDIEGSSFYLEFMTKPSKHKLEKLLAKDRKKIIIKHDVGEFDLSLLPYGQNLLIEYMRYYRKKFSNNKLKIFAYVTSVIRQAYYITIKVNNVCMQIDSKSELFYVITINIFFAITELLFWGQTIQILLLYFQDLRRKTFILNQMSHLISPKRVDIELEDEKKLYPTLELVCPVTMRSWASLRKITLEYGEKFSQRIQILVSIFISLFFGVFVINLVQYFELICLSYIKIEFIYLYLFDISCVVLITIKCIFMGGKINEHFNIHSELLYRNKLLYTELISKFKIWFRPDYVIINPLYRRLINDYRNLQKAFKFDDNQLLQFIRDNIIICDMHILDIQIQSKDNPYKVFGIAMTPQLGMTILTAFLSLICSLVSQYIYSKP